MSDCDYTTLRHGDTALVWLVDQELMEPQTGVFISIGGAERWSIGGLPYPLLAVARFIPMRRALAANDLLAACERMVNTSRRYYEEQWTCSHDHSAMCDESCMSPLRRAEAAIAKARGEVQP